MWVKNLFSIYICIVLIHTWAGSIKLETQLSQTSASETDSFRLGPLSPVCVDDSMEGEEGDLCSQTTSSQDSSDDVEGSADDTLERIALGARERRDSGVGSSLTRASRFEWNLYIYIIHSGTANRMGEVGVGLDGYRFGHCLILFRTILIFMYSVYLSPDWNKWQWGKLLLVSNKQLPLCLMCYTCRPLCFCLLLSN